MHEDRARTSDGPAVRVRGLHEHYGDHHVVDGVDLTVRRGEVFALLGPNGAGRTTTVEVLEGYRDRAGGEVEVLGQAPRGPRGSSGRGSGSSPSTPATSPSSP